MELESKTAERHTPDCCPVRHSTHIEAKGDVLRCATCGFTLKIIKDQEEQHD